LHSLNGIFIFIVSAVFIFFFHEKLALVFLSSTVSALAFERVGIKKEKTAVFLLVAVLSVIHALF